MRQPDPIYLHSPGVISAAGIGLNETAATLFSPTLKPLPVYDHLIEGKHLPYGLVSEISPNPTMKEPFLVRTHQLIARCIQTMQGIDELKNKYDPRRIAVVLGSSTSGMREIEEYCRYQTKKGVFPDGACVDALNLGEPARFCADLIGAEGPVYTVSNACAASAVSFAAAARLIHADMADAVVTGGIDGFALFTTLGFLSLGAVSEKQCQPFGADRNGINLGEGGALFVLSKEESPVQFAGSGETCDAYHASAPEPTGMQASAAMQKALSQAGLTPSDIDFVSAHGTATPLNDSMEAAAIYRVFGNTVPTASLKPLTGHTLGGAGALQAAYAWILLTMNPGGKLPVNHIECKLDPALAAADIVTAPRQLGRPLRAVMGNAFAFGGSNCALVFKRTSYCD